MIAKQFGRSLRRSGAFLTAVALIGISLEGCGHDKPLVVGAKSSTEQAILGEIMAQHLEHRLGRKVERRPNLGGTSFAYQALQGGEVSLYAEYTGAIITELLKEQPASNPDEIQERARVEMGRVSNVALLPALGFDNPLTLVIRANDPRAPKVESLDDAAQVKEGWKIGVSYDFQQRTDGISLLTPYRLPMTAAVRGMDGALLFPALQRGELSMIVASLTDGALASGDWKVLADNRHLFTPEQACILVRQDVITKEPAVGNALKELSGKITTDQMRKMNARVDTNHVPAAAVAADFLTSAGLR